MNLLQLAWKNLKFKPLPTLLSIILFALGIGLISLLFLMQDQLQRNFEKNLAGVDLVVGAKGSPLQLILSSMYHIDAPTGNISLKSAKPFLNPKNPIIDEAVPLSMGDSYRAYRIVGTDQKILNWYGAEIGEGKLWERNFETTIGASVAEQLNLKIGDTFESSHGLMDDEDQDHVHETAFTVVGILKPSGTVLDQLILTTHQSYWLVHEHEEEASAPEKAADEEHDDHEGHDHDHDGHDHDLDGHDHDHDGHDHDHDGHDHGLEIPKSLLDEDPERNITSLLIKFKGQNIQTLNMQRNINENTDMQAATPAIEINRLYALMASGERALRILAFVIMIVSGLSIFISLFNSLRDRKYELALMRVMGARPVKLFNLIILEGLLLAIIGFIVGILLSHISMQFLAGNLNESYRYSFSGFTFLQKEWLLLAAALVIGFIAAVIPASQASRTEISETLSAG